jgi:Bacterial regulatory proteins, luxR family
VNGRRRPPQSTQHRGDDSVLLVLGTAGQRGSGRAPFEEQRTGVVEGHVRVQVNCTVARPLPQSFCFVLCLRVPAHDFQDDVPTLRMCRRDPGGRTTRLEGLPQEQPPSRGQLTHRVREALQPGPSPLSRQAVDEALRDPQRGHATIATHGPGAFISDTTVKTHIPHILQKLNLLDRVQAVVLAYETGVFDDARSARNSDEHRAR